MLGNKRYLDCYKYAPSIDILLATKSLLGFQFLIGFVVIKYLGELNVNGSGAVRFIQHNVSIRASLTINISDFTMQFDQHKKICFASCERPSVLSTSTLRNNAVVYPILEDIREVFDRKFQIWLENRCLLTVRKNSVRQQI